MPGNLRDRLNRIRLMRQGGEGPPDTKKAATQSPAAVLPGWVSAGHMTLRRTIIADEDIDFPALMPEEAGIVMPGMTMPHMTMESCEHLLFFDLETTGLSGGAGTVAFLAAFGRLIPRDHTYNLHITQYLLLDYPGEYDFINAVLEEFKNDRIIVSFNGKTFDSQILKTRCLMNGMIPPEYRHADLLHPSRRLWKHLLPDCSQGTIETGILGIDRTGDTPGAMAPEIWFSFLKNGETEALMGICDHNCRDIAGLAAICAALTQIAENPFSAVKKIMFDFEALALHWYSLTHRSRWSCRNSRLSETGQRLLRAAAEKGYPRAEFQYALSLLKAHQHNSGRQWLFRAADNAASSSTQKASALRSLAIDSEHRLRNTAEAIAFTEKGLELLPPDSPLRKDFERRHERLRKKSAPFITN